MANRQVMRSRSRHLVSTHTKMASFGSKFLKKRFAKATDLEAFSDRKSPVLRLANKITQGGNSVAEAVISDGPQGFSYSLPAAQVVSAQANRGASNYDEFVSQFGEYHGSVVVSARAVAGSKTNEDAYCRQLTEAMTSGLAKFGSVAARRILGPVGGALARISAVNGGGTNGELTLTVRGDTFNIAPGMILQAADSTGNGIPTNVRAGLGYVISVFPDGDTDTTQVRVATSEALQIAGTVGLPSGWANSDYVFRNGDIAAATDLSDVAIRSLQSWITATTATDTYNGVNRAQDQRFSGIRIANADINGANVLDRMTLLVNEAMSQAGTLTIDYIVVGPRTWQQAADEGKQFGFFEFGKADARIGVSALTVMTVSGPVQVVADPYCLEADIWAMTSENLKIYNYDGFPGLDDGDGNELLRQNAAAQYEVRYHAFNCLTVSGKPWTFGRCASGN